jgi:esterase/lipase superfamily enzyme
VIYFLDLRGRNVGGPVLPGRLVNAADAATGTEQDLARETRVVFLVHGFNVNRDDGQEKLLTLARNLPSSADAGCVAVTWPGDSWARFASYSFEGNDADDSGAELARFIDRVLPAGMELAFVSHSLGARVVMECLRRLPAGRYKVGQVCVMAAAIDDTSLADPHVYLQVAEEVGRVAVLSSEKDTVLRFAYPLGDALQAFLFFRRDHAGRALGLRGPRAKGSEEVPSPVIHTHISDGCEVNHSDYLDGEPPYVSRLAAARFADAVVSGRPSPEYA